MSGFQKYIFFDIKKLISGIFNLTHEDVTAQG